jgi:ABC-type multidrug transport system ATPase subunit
MESMTAAVPRQAQGDGTIVVQGLRHEYRGGTVALDGVDLSFGTGLFGLLGPNGAGKSTLMRIMCTLLVPTAGRVTVAGHDVVRERQAVRALLGYLPQEFGAWRLHRVEEVVDTMARLSGLRDRAARKKRVRDALEQVGLQEVADRKVKKLSGGMVRRLGVAQALVHDPRILIVDEPTVGLDPEERLRFRKLMAELGRDRTIVLSTHIVADLGSSCHDLALIDAGKIVYRGSPTGLLSQARGRVFRLVQAGDADRPLGPGIETVSRAAEGGQVTLRAVSRDRELPAGAETVNEPTLEEAYLAFMLARDRAEGVLVEEPA